jgi:hypothetical protein
MLSKVGKMLDLGTSDYEGEILYRASSLILSWTKPEENKTSTEDLGRESVEATTEIEVCDEHKAQP